MQIEIDANGAKRLLTRSVRRVQKPSRLMKLVSGEVAEIFRENFRRLDKSRSRYGHAFYVREGTDVTTSEVASDGNSATVVVASVAMAHKLRGGTVRAKNAKFLAIPVSGWAKSQKRNPGSIPGWICSSSKADGAHSPAKTPPEDSTVSTTFSCAP